MATSAELQRQITRIALIPTTHGDIFPYKSLVYEVYKQKSRLEKVMM